MIAFTWLSLEQQLQPFAEWLGTFALHSTVALGLTFALVRLRGQRSLGLQDMLLRQAMLLPLFSATLQYLCFGSMWQSLLAEPPVTVDELVPLASMLSEEPAHAFSASAAAGAPLPWASIVVLAAAACALLGLFWLTRTWRRLTRILATRRPETDPRILSAAATMATYLGLRQSPHISQAQGLSTPIAFGFVRPEICLPARATSLDDASLRAMLGHELAHLRRADQAWMWLGAWLQALFPWQLLLAASRRQWSRVVELRCDAEAAQHTSATAVARCLIEVAEWLRPQPEQPMVALGMAARPSALRERVEAALGAGAKTSEPVRRFAAGGMAVFSLATLTVAAPGLGEQPVAALSANEFAAAIAADAPDASQRLQPFVALVDQEYRALLVEAEDLQVRLQTSLQPNSQTASLQAQLQSRISHISQLHARLMARVSGFTFSNR